MCAYPAMKEVCEYWMDRLETLPDGTTGDAHRAFARTDARRERGVSFDQQTIWDLFTSTIEAADPLGVDAEFRAELAARRAKLLPPKIGKWGQFQEWMVDRDDPKDTHRHIRTCSRSIPAVKSARQHAGVGQGRGISLNARGDESTGWSTAWKISLWARLYDGDHAHKLFAYLIRPCTAGDGQRGRRPLRQLVRCLSAFPD